MLYFSWSLIIVLLLYHILYRKKINDELKDFKQILESCNNGQLYNVGSKNDDLGSDVNRLIEKYQDIISNNKYLNKKYMYKINNSYNIFEEIFIELQGILENIERLSANIEEQSSSMMSVSSFVDLVSENIEKNASHSQEVLSVSERTYEMIKLKKIEIEEAVESFKSIRGMLSNAKVSTENLDNKTKSAQNLIQGINQISSQINLLALNASIEAARAGEYGAGFTVVANEVRKLAEETKQVTKEIIDIINQIKVDSESTKSIMDTTVEKVRTQSENLTETIKGLDLIEDITQRLANETGSNTKETMIITDKFTNIRELITNITKSTEEVAISTSAISNSVSDEYEAMNELKQSLKDIDELNTINTNKLRKYKIDNNIILTIAYTNFPPFCYYNKSSECIEGIDVDIISKVYDMNGIKVDPIITSWDKSLELLRSGEIDLINGVSDDGNRGYMDFSKPYRGGEKLIFLRLKDSNVSIRGLDDVKRYRIGLVDSYEYADEISKDDDVTKDYSITEHLLIKKLIKGQIDAALINSYTGQYFIKYHNMQNYIVNEPFYLQDDDLAESRLGFTRRKDLHRYVEIFDRDYNKLEESGIVEEIYNKYLK